MNDHVWIEDEEVKEEEADAAEDGRDRATDAAATVAGCGREGDTTVARAPAVAAPPA